MRLCIAALTWSYPTVSLSVPLSKFATICKILRRQALRLHRYHPMSYWIRFAWSAMAISAHDKHSQNVDSQNHSIHGLTWTLHSVGSKIHGTTSRLVRFHGPSKVRNESILTEYCRVIENRLYAIDQRTYSWNQSTLFVKVVVGLPISASLMIRTYLWKISAEIRRTIAEHVAGCRVVYLPTWSTKWFLNGRPRNGRMSSSIA